MADEKEKKSVVKILVFIAIILASLYAGFYVFILGVITNVKLIPFFLFGLIFLCTFLFFVLFKGKNNSVKKIVFGISSLVCFGVFAGKWYYDFQYIPSITVNDLSQRFNVGKYLPFTDDNKLAKLDEKSNLQLERNQIPIMDGATALVPVYASFINATCSNDDIYFDTMYNKYRLQDDVDDEGKERIPWFYSTTNNAFVGLAKGVRDLIFCAQPSEKQIEIAKEHGVEFILTPIGREGFVFFVNEKNPVENLTLDQVKDIYSGKIKNWKEVGGDDVPIKAYQRDEGSGSQTALKWMMGETEIMKPSQEEVVDFMSGIIHKVENYKNRKDAIGFSFRFFTQEMMENHKVKLLKIDGVEPSLENISSKKYPLTSNFYAITTEKSSNTKEFIDWILSEQGQQLIEKTGYARR